MDFETLVRTRRSVRGYKTDPVPKEIIQEIIDVAKGAPSSMNTQPWNLYVVTGEPLDKIRQGNTERMLAGGNLSAISPRKKPTRAFIASVRSK
jgi:nitroreductase